MCGIVGTIGKVDVRKFLINGLYSLEYRGYDSAGISFFQGDKKITCYKAVGIVAKLDEKTPIDIDTHVGIGHTRWATHGAPSVKNSHPHTSNKEIFSIVHNGVIENYRFLKTKLESRGYKFHSDTDTEVIANLLEYNWKSNDDILEVLESTIKDLKGSFAVAILYKKDPGKIYFIKRGSPLLIGTSPEASFLGSDAVPMVEYTDKFIDIEDESYGYISQDNVSIYNDGKKVEIVYSEKNPDSFKRDKGNYPHFMLKEIEETPRIISTLIDNYFGNQEFNFDNSLIEALRNAKEVIFIACGTSYNAALQGVEYMNFLGKHSSAHIASEWAYYPKFISKNPFYVLLSQSGETADLIKCQKIINKRGLINLAIVNSKGSTLERDATYSCLLYCGLEVSVASTKVYNAQVALLSLLIGAMSNSTNVISHLFKIIESCNYVIDHKKQLSEITHEFSKSNMIFFIGRGADYITAKETALKTKEVSYIHSEAIPSGELKHGPIAVVDKDTTLIAFVSDITSEAQSRSNVQEVEARNASSYIFSMAGLDKKGDAFVIPTVKEYLSTIPLAIVGQYLAYYSALERGCDVDKPRNLAKSVTVE